MPSFKYDLLSVQQAAEILGVARMTVYRMLKDGRLHVVAMVGPSVALERAEVDQLLAAIQAEKFSA